MHPKFAGCGVVFKLSPGGTETVLHTFKGSDGAFPEAGLIADSSGNLYGTTLVGGAPGCFAALGCGTVYKALAGRDRDRPVHLYGRQRRG
jgi:hypothetical protein